MTDTSNNGSGDSSSPFAGFVQTPETRRLLTRMLHIDAVAAGYPTSSELAESAKHRLAPELLPVAILRAVHMPSLVEITPAIAAQTFLDLGYNRRDILASCMFTLVDTATLGDATRDANMFLRDCYDDARRITPDDTRQIMTDVLVALEAQAEMRQVIIGAILTVTSGAIVTMCVAAANEAAMDVPGMSHHRPHGSK